MGNKTPPYPAYPAWTEARYCKDTGQIFLDGKLVKQHVTKNGYGYVIVRGSRFLAHRLAFALVTGEFPTNDVDHINGDRLDNRWVNLRLATRQQNLFNRDKNRNKKLPKNVYAHPSGRYRVKMKVDSVTKHFGYYDTAEDAAEAAELVQHAVHGEWGLCNRHG